MDTPDEDFQSSDNLRISLQLPAQVLDILQTDLDGLQRELKEHIAVRLFCDGEISSGKAAELVGFSKGQFIDVLSKHGVNYFTDSPAELTDQIEALKNIHSSPAEMDE